MADNTVNTQPAAGDPQRRIMPEWMLADEEISTIIETVPGLATGLKNGKPGWIELLIDKALKAQARKLLEWQITPCEKREHKMWGAHLRLECPACMNELGKQLGLIPEKEPFP
jgi:hypothetical protein